MNSSTLRPRLPVGLCLTGILVLGLLLRLWAVRECSFVGVDGGVDGVAMLTAGKNLFSGAGFSFQGRPETIHAPLFPILGGILWRLGGDLELSGQLISSLSGALAVAAIFILARLIYNRTAIALYSAALAAIFPPFIFGATEIRLASLYSLLYLIIAIFLYRTTLRPNFLNGLFSGGAIGLAYLTRPEAVIFLPLGGLLLLLKEGRRAGKKMGKIVPAWIGMGLAFFLLAFPYLLFLHHHLDHWTLSARSPFTFIPYFAADWEKSNFEVYTYPERIREEWASRGGMRWVLKEHGREMVGRFIHNLGAIFTMGRSTESFLLKLPPLLINFVSSLFALLLLGLLLLKLRSRSWVFSDTFILLLCLPLIPYFFLTDFLTSQKLRYCYPYFVWVIIIVSSLIVRRPGSAWRRTVGVILLAASFLVSLYLIPRKVNRVPYEYKLLGLWMKDELPGVSRSTVMSQRMGVCFYAGARHVQTYPGSYPEVLEYARQSGADYLMVNDWTTPRLRPSLIFLLGDDKPPPELEMVHTVAYRGRRAILYKFLLGK